MLQKWKFILTNWINCYFNESSNKEEDVSYESIITIISHLRESFSPDESKSSLFEARTLDEFIAEKYPEFTFENGNIKADTQDELYIAASLLLYFVCVSSKDVDMKSAMCSKLSREDQETIMKFSKSLMECSPVTYTAVQAAIAEACGLEQAASSETGSTKVAATPPALRSLHGEVRRLQAALDAERFDRNYLQEELTRTNLRMDKLVKDKEQYKLEILNLKAKISMCCGGDSEVQGAEGADENTAKLTRQLHDLEERLCITQEKLDELQYEKDVYKAKVDELKRERDKWLSVSQTESSRAEQLAEDLELEKRNNQSLRELVLELQQHNLKNNGMDSSQLEWDDPNSSNMSLHNNSSVLSEACANVIEVMLGEEKAKVATLKQQIQSLQDQIADLNEKAENDKKSYESLITDKDNEISNLKHRINEEIEQKNKLKFQHDNELTKLNNDLNEIEQQLADQKQFSAATLAEKLKEIQTLQEEKLFLAQGLSEKTSELENIIQDLQNNIDKEKNLKAKMKEDYENLLMKLNEKVLNRNNELVELQNNVFEKSEMIEELQLQLRTAKEKFDEQIEELNERITSIEMKLQQKTDEAKELQRRLVQNVEVFAELNREIDELKDANVSICHINQCLEETKGSLMAELASRDSCNEEIRKEIENITNIFSEEKDRLMRCLDERNNAIINLQAQLQEEERFKANNKTELDTLHQANSVLSEEVSKLKAELANLKVEFQEKERMIYALDLYLKEERHTNMRLKTEYEELNEQYKSVMAEIKKDKKAHAEEIQKKKDELAKRDEELIQKEAELLNKDTELVEKEDEIRNLNDQLYKLFETKRILIADYANLTEEKNNLEKQLIERCGEMLRLQQDHEKLCKTTENNVIMIETLNMQLSVEKMKYSELQNDFDVQTSNLLSKLSDTEKNVSEFNAKSKHVIEEKELQMQILQHEVEKFSKAIEKERENCSKIKKELEFVSEKLSAEISYKNEFEKEYQSKIMAYDKIVEQLTGDILSKNDEMNALRTEIASLKIIIDDNLKDMKIKEDRLTNECEATKFIIIQKDQELKQLKKKIGELESLTDEYEIELKKEIDSKSQAIAALQSENEQLHFAIEEDNSNHEEILKEKDTVIERLEQHLKTTTVQLESIRKDYEDGILMWEKSKIEMRENLEKKESQITKLKELNKTLEDKAAALENAKAELHFKIDDIVAKNNENDIKRKDQIVGYTNTIKQLETKLRTAEGQINDLKELLASEKIVRGSLISDKKKLEKSLNAETEAKNVLMVKIECLSKKLADQSQIKENYEEKRAMIQLSKEELEKKIIELTEKKQELEKERDCLILEKDRLNVKLKEVDEAKTLTSTEIKQILELLEEEKTMKENFLSAKEKLLTENNCLRNNIEELGTIQEVLVTDKELLMDEKEDLSKCLSEEKHTRDELETEKEAVSVGLRDKQNELTSLSSELSNLKTEYKKHEDINVNMASLLSGGLEDLFQNIKKDDVSNQVLLKLINSDKGNMPVFDQCVLLVNVAKTMATELSVKKTLEKALEHENIALSDLKNMLNQKEFKIMELQSEIKKLQQMVHENKIELSKQTETYSTSLDAKIREVQKLQLENKTLNNELNNVKVQLEVKVHSLKEKLVDNENLTDKLKKTYECQIDNLNLMINKLTCYLKDKTAELDLIRKENDRLKQIVDDNNKVIRNLEDDVKTQKMNQEKLISDFESERLVLKNMVTVTESVMEDTKISLNKLLTDQTRVNETLQDENKMLQEKLETEKRTCELKVQEKENAFDMAFKELSELRTQKEQFMEEVLKKLSIEEGSTMKEEIYSTLIERLETQYKSMEDTQMRFKTEIELQRDKWDSKIAALVEEVKQKDAIIDELQLRNNELSDTLTVIKHQISTLEAQDEELKVKKETLERELLEEIEKLTNVINGDTNKNDKFKSSLKDRLQTRVDILDKVKILSEEILEIVVQKNQFISKLDELKADFETNELIAREELESLRQDNTELAASVEEKHKRILDLEQEIAFEKESFEKLREQYQTKAEKQIKERDHEICSLRDKIERIKSTFSNDQSVVATLGERIEKLKDKLTEYEQKLYDKDTLIANMAQEKDAVISTISKELLEERAAREKYQKEIESNTVTLYELQQKLEDFKNEAKAFKSENEEMMRVAAQRDITSASQERTSAERDRDRHQVSTPTSDLTHSSLESIKTINDLEKIIHDKNRTITTLQSDITYLKSLMAESENKLLDVTKELGATTENCEQLSSQLKKIVQQKNEEIAELKKHVSKLNLVETQSKQIIKVSAKYQAMILKRIAEIKSNTILKELTNFGNATNSDSDLKRSLNAGAITMEDLENFLETTDRHLKRCSEKQLALQKERDRLYEVNKINESEIINSKKFLTELSVSFRTFSSVRDVYAQKLSKVVSVQRTVRREILNLDGHLTDKMMCKLERGYAAVMQDLSECAMNLERWMERCISRTISPEKIKQAFTSDTERTSLASTIFQNTSLEVQLEELEKSFQKLMEEVTRAPKGEGARDPQAVTVMEVRAEYEDKLNRMKAKMKQLYQEQIAMFKEQQKKEIYVLEKELEKAREKLEESSQAYEQHIRGLTSELWSVGEKLLMKKDEAEWWRKRKSGSLMSLQHVHSSGLMPALSEATGRPSDTHSLRSLPVAHVFPREKRGLHMSDEEGEVFDNRCLKELSETPRRFGREPMPTGERLSELRYRNSLCPPHLRSSYPAEMQFRDTFDEEDLKCAGGPPLARQPRKEVGITAYKKPGPPTPSKQAGRLSATDAELRESIRVEGDPTASTAATGVTLEHSRKTSTPSRLRALFRSARENVDGTPRSKRLSLFRKK